MLLMYVPLCLSSAMSLKVLTSDKVNQTGTYWYHSHRMGQYPDGLRGPIVVHDPNPPFVYDDEFTVIFSDWYHEQMSPLMDQYKADTSDPMTGGLEPLPDGSLINEVVNATFRVEPGKTYLVHFVVVGNWPGFAFGFDEHEMTIVEVDGVYTEPFAAGERNVRLASAQRLSALIHTKNNTNHNYALWAIMDLNMMFFYENRTIPKGFNPNATAWLVYDESLPLPAAPSIHEFDFVDDLEFVPADREPLLEPVDHQIVMDFNSASVGDGLVRFVINNKTYYEQDTPSLYTALLQETQNMDSGDLSAYGAVNPYVVNYGDVVELIVNDHHSNLHPWHLHGHHFQCLQRTYPDGGYFDGYFANISATPMKRDTLMVQNHGHFVIRFRATNPDKWIAIFSFFRSSVLTIILRVWLFHCHIEWHVAKGMVTTIIEAPDHIGELRIPGDHLQLCGNYPFASELGLQPTKSSTPTIPNSTPGSMSRTRTSMTTVTTTV
jgi:iron transport multicopper oxidase